MIIIIIILVILLAGGGYGYRSDWGGPQFGGLFGVILVLLLIYYLLGHRL